MSPVTKIAAALAVTTALAAAAPVAEGGRKFTTVLTGQAEIDGGAATADMDATGTAHIFVNVGQRRVCWEYTDVTNLETLTAAHIHEAPADDSGPPVVPFTTAMEGCTASNLDRALLIDIIQNPQDYYVNLHTATYPGGAIRGQLHK